VLQVDMATELTHVIHNFDASYSPRVLASNPLTEVDMFIRSILMMIHRIQILSNPNRSTLHFNSPPLLALPPLKHEFRPSEQRKTRRPEENLPIPRTQYTLD
jgi:hypothetical protein